MSYGCVVVARNLEDVASELRRLPNCKIVDGPRTLNECRNLGASRLQTDLIAFIDDDNRLATDALEEMAKAFYDSSVGAVSPLIFDGNGSVWFAGMRWNPLGIALISRRTPKHSLLLTEGFHNVFMVKREAFEKAGGFDAKRFPFYLGEADLAERMKRLGYVFLVAKNAKVWHGIGRGLARGSHIRSDERAYLVGRNRLLFLKLHKSLGTYIAHVILILPFLAAYHILGMVSQRKYGFVKNYLRGIKDGLMGRF